MNKIIKRIISSVTAVAVTLTAVFVFDVPEMVARAAASGSGWSLDNNGILTIANDAGMDEWCRLGRGDNKSVKKLIIKNGVTYIKNIAFWGCSNMTSVEIPNTVKKIEGSAFMNCENLPSITIPSSVTSIETSAFLGCLNLSSITIPRGVTTIANSLFSGCTKLTSVTIPNTVTSIGQEAFSGCENLSAITIPNSVASIGIFVFYACSSLTSITIPSSVASIGKGAFSKCSSLTSITIPSSVTSVGTSVFKQSGLVTATFNGTTPPAGLDDMFDNADALTAIFVPCTAEETYKDAIGFFGPQENVKPNHNETEIRNTRAATCIQEGYTGDTYCKSCNNIIESGSTIAKTAHSYSSAWSSDASQHWHQCVNSGCAEKSGAANHNFVQKKDGANHWQECSVCGYKKDETAHNWNGGEITKAQTCTETGVRTYTCSDCGATKTVDIAAEGHNSEGVIAHKDATCTEDGVVGGTYCTKCDNGKTAAEAVITKLGHSRNDGEITKAPTCTETGVKTYTCTRCGAKETEEIAANGHNSEGSVPHVDATCTADGVVGGSYCTVCNDGKAAAESVISATGHKFGSDWKHDGTRHWHECVNTGCTEKSDISVHTFEYETDDAKHWEKCTVCGCAKDAEAHVWGAWTLTHPPTMTAAGTAEHVCAVCQKARSTAVPALTDPIWTKDDTQHVDPTEETMGKDVYHSDEFGDVEVPIPEIEHVHNNFKHVPEVPPTETTEGVKEHWECRCGEKYFDEEGKQPATDDDLRIGILKAEVQAPEGVPKTELSVPHSELMEATLEDKDKTAMESGKDIKIILKVENADQRVPADEKTSVNAEIGKMSQYKLGQFLDVTLLKQIGEDAAQAQKITQTKKPLRITFEIPSALRGQAEYSVIRVHDGKTTILRDLDSDPNTVTIETDKFSTYALTYKEKTSGGGSGGSSGGGSSHHHRYIYDETIIKEPTCTESGEKTLSCSCGETATETVPALGHDYHSEITKPATETENGIRTFTCTRCGDTYTEIIEKTGSESKPGDTSSNTSGNTSSGTSDDTSSGTSASGDTSSNSGDTSSDNSGSSSDKDTSSSGGTGEDNPITGAAAVIPLMAVIAAAAALAVTKSRKK